MYAEQQMKRDDANIGALSVFLGGAVSDADIEATCLAIVKRHPALRTVVEPSTTGLLEHELCATDSFHWTQEDLHCAAGEEMNSCRAWIAAHYGMRPWDLTRESGIHFHLLKHGPERQTLAIPVHHICFDGRSKFLFAHEFCQLLADFEEGRHPDLTPIGDRAIESPGDTATALAEYHAAQDEERVDDGYCLNLPRLFSADAPRGSIGTLEFKLSSRSVKALRVIAHDAGASFFGGMLAVAGAALWSYGNDRLVLSLAVDASTPETTDCIGCGINAVPLNIGIEAADDLHSLLVKTKLALDRAKKLRGVPFGEVIGDRDGLAGLAGALYDLGLSFLRLPGEHPSIPGVTTEWDFFSPNFGSPFETSLALRIEAEDSFGRLDYLRSIGDDRSARVFLKDFATALDVLADAPRTRVAELPIRPARIGSAGAPRDERHHRSACPVSWGTPAFSEAVAIESHDVSISYRELSERAEALLGDPTRSEAFFLRKDALDPLEALIATRASLEEASTSASGASPELLWRTATWLAAHSPSSGKKTLHRSVVGSPAYLPEVLSTWAAGGTLVIPAADETSLARQLAATEANRIFARPHEIAELVGATSQLDGHLPEDALISADEPWSPEATRAAIASGIRLNAYFACRESPVVVGAGPVTQDETFCLSPSLTDCAPGFAIEIVGPGGRSLPALVAGSVTLRDAHSTAITDLHGRISPDGGLELLGRHRDVPPAFSARIAEHMARLMAAPGVTAVHVDIERSVASPLKPNAFVVAKRVGEESPMELENRLWRLTSTHHPLATLTVVDNLPRDGSGQVDARELRLAKAPTQPTDVTNPVFDVVCSAWADVFETEEVSYADDFFEIGGNSLSATRLLATIQDRLGVELSLRDLFDHPTVGELSEMAEQELETE